MDIDLFQKIDLDIDCFYELATFQTLYFLTYNDKRLKNKLDRFIEEYVSKIEDVSISIDKLVKIYDFYIKNPKENINCILSLLVQFGCRPTKKSIYKQMSELLIEDRPDEYKDDEFYHVCGGIDCYYELRALWYLNKFTSNDEEMYEKFQEFQEYYTKRIWEMNSEKMDKVYKYYRLNFRLGNGDGRFVVSQFKFPDYIDTKRSIEFALLEYQPKRLPDRFVNSIDKLFPPPGVAPKILRKY